MEVSTSSHARHLSTNPSNYNSQDLGHSLGALREISKQDSTATDDSSRSASILNSGPVTLVGDSNQSAFINPNLNAANGNAFVPSLVSGPSIPMEVHDVTPNGDEMKEAQKPPVPVSNQSSIEEEFRDRLVPQCSDSSNPSKSMLNVLAPHGHRPITPFDVVPNASSNDPSFSFNVNNESNVNNNELNENAVELTQLMAMMQYLPQINEIIKTLESLRQQISVFQPDQQHDLHRMGRERSHSESSMNSLHTMASMTSTATNMQYDAFWALLRAQQSGFGLIPGAAGGTTGTASMGNLSMGTGSRREREVGIEGRRTPLKSPREKKFLEQRRRQSKNYGHLTQYSQSHSRRKSNPAGLDTMSPQKQAQELKMNLASKRQSKKEEKPDSLETYKMAMAGRAKEDTEKAQKSGSDLSKKAKNRSSGPPPAPKRLRKRSKSQDHDDRSKVGQLKRRKTIGPFRMASSSKAPLSLMMAQKSIEEKNEETDPEEDEAGSSEESDSAISDVDDAVDSAMAIARTRLGTIHSMSETVVDVGNISIMDSEDAIDTVVEAVEHQGFFKQNESPNVMLKDVMESNSLDPRDVAASVPRDASHQRKKPLMAISTKLKAQSTNNVLKFSSPNSPVTAAAGANPHFHIDARLSGTSTPRSRRKSMNAKARHRRRKSSATKPKPSTPSKSAAVTAEPQLLHPIPPKSPSTASLNNSSLSLNPPFASPQRPNTPTYSPMAALPQSPTPTPTNTPMAMASESPSVVYPTSTLSLKPPAEDREDGALSNVMESNVPGSVHPHHLNTDDLESNLSTTWNPMNLSLDPDAYSSDVDCDKVVVVEEEEMIENVRRLPSHYSDHSQHTLDTLTVVASNHGHHGNHGVNDQSQQSVVEEAAQILSNTTDAVNGNGNEVYKTGEDSVTMSMTSSRPPSTKLNKAVHFGVIDEERDLEEEVNQNHIEKRRNLSPSKAARSNPKSGSNINTKSKTTSRRRKEKEKKGHSRKPSLSQKNLTEHDKWTNCKSKLGNMSSRDVERMTNSQLDDLMRYTHDIQSMVIEEKKKRECCSVCHSASRSRVLLLPCRHQTILCSHCLKEKSFKKCIQCRAHVEEVIALR